MHFLLEVLAGVPTPKTLGCPHYNTPLQKVACKPGAWNLCRARPRPLQCC